MIFKTITDETTLSGQRIVGTLQARKIAQQQATVQLEVDIACLKEYQVACQNGTVTTEQFDTIMHKASASAVEYSAKIKAGTGTAQSYANAQRATNSALQEVSIGAGIASKAVKLFSTALNMIAFTAIIQGISWLIGKVDEWIVTAKEANESADALKQSLATFFNETQTNLKTISSLSDRFDELSKNVDDNGKKIGGTEEEYSEFLNICKQVGQIMPELITGYTNEGEAIITLQGKVNSLTDTYKEAIKAKAALFITNGDENGNTIDSFFEDYNNFINGYKKGYIKSPATLQDKTEKFEEYYGYNEIREWLSRVKDMTYEELSNFNSGGASWGVYINRVLHDAKFDINNITSENYNAVHDVLNNKFTVMEKELSNRVLNIRSAFQNMLYADSDYWNINDENVLSAINSLYGSIDAEFIKNNELFSQKALQTFESNSVSLFINDATKKAMVDFYTPIADDETVKDYANRIKSSLETVQSYCDKNGIEIPIAITDSEQTINDLEAQYQRAIDFAKENFDGYDPTAFFKEHSINTQEEIDAWQKIAQEARDATEAEKEYLNLTPKKSPTLFNQLTKSEESLDKFQSGIKSAANAYATLLSGNYSSTDLLDSIQCINQAASDMKGTIAWEEIESLDELGDKIEEISQTYAKSILADAGINSDFGQMLANIIQEAYESEAALASLNTQIDSLQDSYKNLTDIIETYNEHGYLTFDQLQTLLSMEPQYLNCLIDENGQLRMNQEAMRELAEQRLKDARAQIIEQTITELNELQFKKEKTAVDDARMAIEDIGDTLTSYEEKLLGFIPIGELTTEEFIKISNAVNGAASNGVSDEDIDAAFKNAEKKLKFARDMWNGEIGSMFGGFSSSKDATKEFDWIEQAIENVRKEIQSLDEIANSSYATFSQKNAALAKEISKVNEEIVLQQQAYEEYMRKADAIGLGEDYKVLVRDGAINIENISDEDLQKKISDYQQWHEKAVAVSDAISDLNEQLKDLHVRGYELRAERLEDLLNNASITEKQYLEEMKSLYKEYYENQVEYAQKAHEAKLALLEKEKSYLNSVAGAASSLLDREIDKIRDNAEAQEKPLKNQIDAYNEQIDLLNKKKKPLQDELDALEDKARDENLILDLQQKQYNLKRLENQRTKLVYTADQGMIYTSDSSAIRDAKKDVDSAKLEIQKNDIQKQIDALDDEIDRYNDLIDLVNDQIDAVNSAADAQINALEKVKNKWQEVIDQQEYAENISLLTGEFGTDAIEKLLSGNDDDLLAQWKNSYVNTLAGLDMETQGYIGNMTQQIASLYHVDLSVLQSQFQGVKDSVASLDNTIRDETDTAANAFDQHTDKLTNEVVPAIQGAATEMDTFNESAQIVESCIEKANATLSAFSETASKLPVDVFNSMAQSAQSLSGALDHIANTASGALDHIANTAIGNTSTQLKDILSDANGIVDSIKHGNAYGDGTPGSDHDEKNALRSAYAGGTGKDAIITPDGAVLRPLQPGDSMYDTMQKWNAYMDSINRNVEKLIPYSVNDHNRQMSEAARRISNVSNVVNNRNVQPVVNGGINITCPGITSQEVARQVGTELNKMFNGLHLEAEQRSRMR